jgi:hypothetical protein
VLEPFLAFIGKVGELDPIAERRMTADNHTGGKDLRGLNKNLDKCAYYAAF